MRCLNVSNVLGKDKREQVIALGRLRSSLRRIEAAVHSRREAIGGYLRCQIPTRAPGGWGRRAPANEVITDSSTELVANPIRMTVRSITSLLGISLEEGAASPALVTVDRPVCRRKWQPRRLQGSQTGIEDITNTRLHQTAVQCCVSRRKLLGRGALVHRRRIGNDKTPFSSGIASPQAASIGIRRAGRQSIAKNSGLGKYIEWRECLQSIATAIRTTDGYYSCPRRLSPVRRNTPRVGWA